MKFDAIVGNPPYQTKNNHDHRKSTPIWHHFVARSLELLKDNGVMTFIHPSGWRNVNGDFDKVKKLLLSRDLIYLNTNDVQDGNRIFGASTRFDWYTLINRPYRRATEYCDDDGKVGTADLSTLKFIPSSNWDEIHDLLATDEDESVEVIYSRSAYGTDKDHMNDQKTPKHTHACITNVGINNDITKLWWSSTQSNGHFGVPKLVFGRFGSGTFIDRDGEYGLCQDVAAIVDTPRNLIKIQQAMATERFQALMKSSDVGGLGSAFNRKVIPLLKKDFWKNFQ